MLLSMIIFSCSDTLLMEVKLTNELDDKGVIIENYALVMSEVQNEDQLFFDFISSHDLGNTEIVFKSASGKIIYRKSLNDEHILDSNLSTGASAIRVYYYSVPLGQMKSSAFIKEVVIGE